jgi:LysR family transcriptional regulator, low CO2-responsive transcriptional regulator
MEDSVRLPLFAQLSKKVCLIEAVREMLRYSHAAIQQLEGAEVIFNEMKGMKRGRLDVAHPLYLKSTSGFPSSTRW